MRMILLYQTHSPFARKVLVFAHECGLADQLQVEHHETSPTNPNFAKEFLRRERQRRPTMGEVRSLERQIARLKNLSGGNF